MARDAAFLGLSSRYPREPTRFIVDGGPVWPWVPIGVAPCGRALTYRQPDVAD
jgi:hypothetical protein